MNRIFLSALLAMLAFMQVSAAWAAKAGEQKKDAATAEAKVDNTACGACHPVQNESITAGAHGRAFFSTEELGCQSCHIGGSGHIGVVSGKEQFFGEFKIQSFKDKGADPTEKSNPCLVCHISNKNRANWIGSTHQMNGVSCPDCHNPHLRDNTAVRPGICFTCHQDKRAQVTHTKNPMMPRGDGSKECAKCHDPHGGGKGPSLLKTASVNETCYGCHSEKRGPFLFEHAPVTENCANCHDPHGSTNPNFLKLRPPYLCQNCHAGWGHTKSIFDASNLIAGEPQRLIGKSCINCHGMIHGSNHPSGARLQR